MLDVSHGFHLIYQHSNLKCLLIVNLQQLSLKWPSIPIPFPNSIKMKPIRIGHGWNVNHSVIFFADQPEILPEVRHQSQSYCCISSPD